MNRKPHHNTVWLAPAQAARIYGYRMHTFRRWAEDGKVRFKENKLRKGAWLYNKKDIEELIGIQP